MGKGYSAIEARRRAFLATLTSKGQVTLPSALRRHLRLGTGKKVLFVLDDDGTVRMEVPAYPDVRSLMGAAGSLEKPLPWDTVRDIAREDQLAAKHRSGTA